jgi:integrase
MHVNHSRTKVKGEWTEHSTKSGNARLVPVPAWLVEDLAAYLTTHPYRSDRDAPLWPGRKHAPAHGGLRGTVDWSQPWSSSVFGRRAWPEAFAATGVERCRFHDLRHTYVSLMAQQGVPLLCRSTPVTPTPGSPRTSTCTLSERRPGQCSPLTRPIVHISHSS